MDRSIDEQLRRHPCPDCGQLTLELQLRPRLEARPLGTWSLAGAQPKTSAVEVEWPYAVCTGDDCNFETAAKRVASNTLPLM